jgi:hypothetical protein
MEIAIANRLDPTVHPFFTVSSSVSGSKGLARVDTGDSWRCPSTRRVNHGCWIYLQNCSSGVELIVSHPGVRRRVPDVMKMIEGIEAATPNRQPC